VKKIIKWRIVFFRGIILNKSLNKKGEKWFVR